MDMARTVESDLGGFMRSVGKIALLRRAVGSWGKTKLSEYSDGGSVLSRTATPTHVGDGDDDDDEKLRRREAMETLISELFASIAAIKAEYAQLQVAQSPYDPETIQSSDRLVVSQLKHLSLLKQAYLKRLPINGSGGGGSSGSRLAAELQEQRNLLRTFEITSKKLESDLERKDSQILLLKNQVSETEAICRWMEENIGPNIKRPSEKKLDGHFRLSSVDPALFLAVLRRAVKSIRSFVKLMVKEMEAARWNLTAAAGSIAPDVLRGRPEDRSFAFESYVCRIIFSGFHLRDFELGHGGAAGRPPSSFLDEFLDLKDADLGEILRRPSPLSEFCRVKYLALVHPAMEASFGGQTQRDLLSSSGGGSFPVTTQFLVQFAEMARRVWLLHRLFFSFEPAAEASIFQAGRGCRFSELFMESVVDEAGAAAVGFTVVPGFRVGRTIIQCKVYPARAAEGR
ncbi:unnamed protein product [Spirodela intermedia]|uniref:Uncharacterized protein n=1 Tax=Spirodela intermedia TaxID=51605 RepID=A0A7I8LEZ3_SPIIN|nr:unnamed protein product [Spirodela intermedia]